MAPVGTAYGFTGELTDGNGLVYLRARYLAPALGTFASRDPWRGSASAPRTWNGYAWVEGNVVGSACARTLCTGDAANRPPQGVNARRCVRWAGTLPPTCHIAPQGAMWVRHVEAHGSPHRRLRWPAFSWRTLPPIRQPR